MFAETASVPAVTDELVYDAGLSQWMTPAWAAEAIVAHALPNLPAKAVVVEPSCGIGRFLDALPHHVRAVGVEIDSALADIARRRTGATIVTGDFRTVDLPIDECDAIIGNPPFNLEIVDGMLERGHGLLRDGGQMILVLPTFAFQTSARVVRYNRRWSLAQEMMPRTLFPGIRLPLVLARFTRDPRPTMTGFILYNETREIEEMPEVYRKALTEGRSGWRAVVEAALSRLGGEGTVQQVCAEIEPRRPTDTRHWRAKVRQQLTTGFIKTGSARYAIAA